MTTKPVNTGGRLTLEQQAEHNHIKGEIRVDLAMSKLTDKVLKHLAKMVNKIDNLKENTQLAVIDKVLKANKDYMKAKQELETANNKASDESYLEDEEEETMMIDLTSSETASKVLQ